jgi:hypothetical protein
MIKAIFIVCAFGRKIKNSTNMKLIKSLNSLLALRDGFTTTEMFKNGGGSSLYRKS